MTFLADQDVYAATIGFGRGLSHAVVTAAQVLATYSKEHLRQSFVVAEPDRHRVRRLSA